MNHTMKLLSTTLIFILLSFAACNKSSEQSVFEKSKQEDIDKLKHITENLVAPPLLPEYEQVDNNDPVIVDVKLVIQEKKMEIAPGVFTWAFTYNGTVPGPIIVVHQNDYIELTLVNPSTNTMVHNIDFHAATGALGGADFSLVAPGQQATFLFKATKAGVFVYHCAPGGIMIPLHVVSGMNGAIMVLPRDGLKDENGNPVHYDKAYYLAEQDFYIPKDKNGDYKQYATPAEGLGDLMQTMKGLIPSFVVFEGKVDTLTGTNALTANVGDKVLFITSSANRDTRMHIIGGNGDLVWLNGSFSEKPVTNCSVWPIPGGDAVAAIYQFREPGTYIYVDHNLIEGYALGAMAQIDVKGKWDNNLMKQVSKPGPIK